MEGCIYQVLCRAASMQNVFALTLATSSGGFLFDVCVVLPVEDADDGLRICTTARQIAVLNRFSAFLEVGVGELLGFFGGDIDRCGEVGIAARLGQYCSTQCVAGVGFKSGDGNHAVVFHSCQFECRHAVGVDRGVAGDVRCQSWIR